MSSLQDGIRQLRDRQGWSQQDLADRSGLSRQTIISAEKKGRERALNSRTLDKIARGLDLPDAEALWLAIAEMEDTEAQSNG